MRGTGGNRFIDHDASISDLVMAVQRGLRELRDYAEDDGRRIDLAAISVETRPTRDGRLISVTVSGDLTPLPPRGGDEPDEATAAKEVG